MLDAVGAGGVDILLHLGDWQFSVCSLQPCRAVPLVRAGMKTCRNWRIGSASGRFASGRYTIRSCGTWVTRALGAWCGTIWNSSSGYGSGEGSTIARAPSELANGP